MSPLVAMMASRMSFAVASKYASAPSRSSSSVKRA